MKAKTPIFFEKPTHLNSSNHLRLLVLCEAIERYLFCRGNKDALDKRGFKVTYFTRLKHYTAFGEHRANQLKQMLLSDPENWLSIVQNFFSEHPRLRDHSLAT